MRLALASAVALLALGPAAAAAPPTVSIHASTSDGAAPLTVTFTAEGDAVSYHWEFGDGGSADGPSVEHTFAAGGWTTKLTARSSEGEETVENISIAARGITLTGSQHVRFARNTTFRGTVVPAERNVAVSVEGQGFAKRTATRADGTFAVRLRLGRPVVLSAHIASASSPPLPVLIVPRLRTVLVGSGARGTRFTLAASIRPRNAGELGVTITRGGAVVFDRTLASPAHVRLGTGRLASYRIRVHVQPNEGFTSAVHLLRARVVLPQLRYGTRSPAVGQLGAQLRSLHYAAPDTTLLDGRMLDAVYAFQKVQGLSRTGVVDPAFWQRLNSPYVPAPRYRLPPDHLEVNKPRQVLYVVRRGRIALIAPVSTAGLPGKFTPVGRFAIYRKVGGFDPSPLGTLYDPMYFTGGYAIHGNPSVPPFPASHGCVRVPMWLAAHLFETNPYGETVYVY